MPRPWVFIDVSYLAYRAHFGLNHLHPVWEDLRTEVLFGFWEQLRVICENERVNSNRVVACCDSPSSLRRKAFPGYKAGRKEDQTPEEQQERKIIHDQMNVLRDVLLPKVGIQVLCQDGLESDDMMAQASLQLREARQPELAILVTGDGDLWQCISPTTLWFDPGRDRLYDVETFIAKKGIHPCLWGQVKCWAGCSSDTVPGVPRVGEKTAVKFLMNQLPSSHKTFQAITSQEGKRIYHDNVDLVILPHEATKPVLLHSPEYSPEAFFSMCEQYGFHSYLKKPLKGKWMDLMTQGRGQRKTRKRGGLR